MTKALAILLACALSTASLAAELWPTDEPLRTGMSRIDAAVTQAAAAQPLSRERAGDLARTVEQNVRYIVENCNLPPEPDAALHALIGRMVAAANRLKEDASSEAAVAQLQSVMHDYRVTFDYAPTVPSHQH